jgi:hypothetical protein
MLLETEALVDQFSVWTLPLGASLLNFLKFRLSTLPFTSNNGGLAKFPGKSTTQASRVRGLHGKKNRPDFCDHLVTGSIRR